MVICQGEVWWADIGMPVGSAPGYRRPVLIVQCDGVNLTRIATVLCVPLTTNLRWSNANGNVLLRTVDTGLDHDSVANVSQTFALDKDQFFEWIGQIDRRLLDRVLAGIDVMLGR